MKHNVFFDEETVMFKLKMLAAVVAGLGLVACGGSSDLPDNPVGAPLLITSANYLSVTQEVLATAVSLVDVSEVLLGTQLVALPSPVSFARSRLPDLWPATANPALLAGVVFENTYPCLGGGNVVETIDDKDNNGFLSAGDTIRETYNSCIEGTEVANGIIRYSFNTLSGDLATDVFNASIGLAFENFRIASTVSLDSVLANGSMTLTTNSRAAEDFDTQLNAPSYREDVSIGGLSVSRTVTNFQTTELRVPTIGGYNTTVTVSGTLTSSILGGSSVAITTPVPLLRSSPSEYPVNGTLLATGAAGSKLRIVAQSDTQVLLELDENGDNIIDPPTPTLRLWSDFI
jgi:hypothetical protein